jgi:hypothetical protein
MTTTLLEVIREAIKESQMLELGVTEPDEDRMLFNAMRLSGAPYSFVREVYQQYAE